MQIMHKFMGDLLMKIEELVKKKSYKEALELLDIQIQKTPGQTSWLTKRGDIYYSMERFGDALNDYNKVIKLDKENKIVLSKAEMTRNILRFQNLDIFESTNLNLDPWLDF